MEISKTVELIKVKQLHDKVARNGKGGLYNGSSPSYIGYLSH
ncbi:MAG: hypothetical protein QXR34_10800 [Saccharolobus sp.]